VALVPRDCGDEHARQRRHGSVGLDKPGPGGVCVLMSVLSALDFRVKTAGVISLLRVKSLSSHPLTRRPRGFVGERHEKWASSREQIQRAEQGEEHAERGAGHNTNWEIVGEWRLANLPVSSRAFVSLASQMRLSGMHRQGPRNSSRASHAAGLMCCSLVGNPAWGVPSI